MVYHKRNCKVRVIDKNNDRYEGKLEKSVSNSIVIGNKEIPIENIELIQRI